MSAYKQEFVDNYWKEDAQVIQESMGFYWAMRSRDFVPFIARVFKKHMYVFQEPSITGSFPNPKLDDSTTCFQDCLLYTSPSPRDAHESRMPSSA